MFTYIAGVLLYHIAGVTYSLAPDGTGNVIDGYGAITAAADARDHSALAVLRAIAPCEYIGLRDATVTAAVNSDFESLDILLDNCDREWSTAYEAAVRDKQTMAAAVIAAAIARVEKAEGR